MSKSSTTIEGMPERVTTSPGEMLREEFLVPLGLSANALALALRVPANRVTAILKDERAVTADTGAMAGNSRRQRWPSARDCSPVIHLESPVRVATLPSSVTR